MKLRQVIGACILAAAVCFAWGGKAQAAPVPEDELTIADGVYVGDLSLAGMTEAEASEAVSEYVNQICQKVLTVDVNGNVVEVSLSDLGVSWVNNTVVQDAVLLGRGGNVIKRYKDLENLKHNEVELSLELAADEERLNQFLTEQVEAYNIAPQDASLTRRGGKFIITESQTGITVNTEETKQAINDAIKEAWKDELSVTASVETAEPAHTSELLGYVQDQLGTCTTIISNMGNQPRLVNVTLASKKANGTVLFPGEEASFNDILGPRNAENGWAKAAEYTETGSKDDYGGGICQASSTLYGALLEAEVTVTERHPHSRKIWYADYSMDAAMAGNYKDLKFRNDFDYPIYIESYVSGNQIIYTIYGKETRPSNRRVDYVSTVVSEEDAGYQDEYRDDLPAGYIEEVRSSYPAITSYLTKNVYVDGKLVSSEKLHTDRYKPLAGIRYIGTGAATGTDANTTPETGGSTDSGSGSTSGSGNTGSGSTGSESGTGSGSGSSGETGGNTDSGNTGNSGNMGESGGSGSTEGSSETESSAQPSAPAQ